MMKDVIYAWTLTNVNPVLTVVMIMHPVRIHKEAIHAIALTITLAMV